MSICITVLTDPHTEYLIWPLYIELFLLSLFFCFSHILLHSLAVFLRVEYSTQVSVPIPTVSLITPIEADVLKIVQEEH